MIPYTQRQTLGMEGCPELERDVVARHGFVHGVRTAILSHSVESVILDQPEITEISISAPKPAEGEGPAVNFTCSKPMSRGGHRGRLCGLNACMVSGQRSCAR